MYNMGSRQVPQKKLLLRELFLLYSTLWIRWARTVCSNRSALVPGEAGAPRQLQQFFMSYLYILQSTRDYTTYVGISKDVEKRLLQHNAGRVKSTKSKKPWLVIHTEFFGALSEAKKREWFLKCTPQGGKEKRKIVEAAGISLGLRPGSRLR